ncbi:hypothetical protein ACFZ8E_07385 [Methylobacterium sp. HMF5984]|uniref:hypothetical protein n=1 Tax=Methylobacterium sp. HMF5984 TaxID=3367370 RepID=UPI003851BE62
MSGRPIRHPVVPKKAPQPNLHGQRRQMRFIGDHGPRQIDKSDVAEFLEHLEYLRDTDSKASITYTERPNTPMLFGDSGIKFGIEVGLALAESGCEVVDVQQVGRLLRWTFPDDAHVLMFKMKMGSKIVPAPWREFFPPLPGESE